MDKDRTVADDFDVVHIFNGRQGANPTATLLLYNGVFYGTATNGGSQNCGKSGCGIVFELKP